MSEDLQFPDHFLFGTATAATQVEGQWAEGYTPRFGLVRVDYATQERHPRPSAEIYARIARARRIEAELFQPRSVRDTRLKRAQGHDP